MKTTIREHRNHRSITQAELAKMAGVRRETIVFLEQGRYNPSLQLAHNIAKALHAHIDDLFIFDDDAYEETERWVVLVD